MTIHANNCDFISTSKRCRSAGKKLRDRESAHANSSSQSAWEIPAGASQPKSLLLLETLAANHVPAFEILAAIFGDLVRISEADTSATPGYAAVC